MLQTISKTFFTILCRITKEIEIKFELYYYNFTCTFLFTHVQPSLELPEYKSFVDEALNEILPQIEKEKYDDLTIFGHKISPLFKIDLFINLLLLSDKK